MNRYDKRDKTPRVHPVERVSLREGRVKLRLALVIALLAIGAAALAFGMKMLLGTEAGWQTVAVNAAETHCGGDFTLRYELGRDQSSATAENRLLTQLYSKAAVRGYRLLSNDETWPELVNLRYINDHPGETLTVEAELFDMLTACAASGSRLLYLAPVYQVYHDLCFAQNDAEAGELDPARNAELGEYVRRVAAFAADPDAVTLEIVGENQLCLRVAPAYAAFAAEWGITAYIDPGWMKNALLADYLADTLAEAGFTAGVLTSADGFTRCLDKGAEYEYILQPGAVLTYRGPMAFATLSAAPLNGASAGRYYIYEDGTSVSAYADPTDGLSRPGCQRLTVYGSGSSCAELALAAAELYIGNSPTAEQAAALSETGLFVFFLTAEAAYYSDTEGTCGSVKNSLETP